MPETNVSLEQFSSAEIKYHRSNTNAPGALYPVRGKGARWKKNSCAADSCIVAIRLLGLASTSTEQGKINRQEMLEHQDPLQKALVNAIDHDWEKKVWKNSELRNEIWKCCIDLFNAKKSANVRGMEVGDLMSANAIWNGCVSMVNRFSFRFRYHKSCSSCSMSPYSRQQLTKFIEPDTGNADAETGVSMQDMLQKHFDTKTSNHRSCSGVGTLGTRRIIEGILPVQLVVCPSPAYQNIRAATSNRIHFSYLSSTLGEQQVVYRWLGGIYRTFLNKEKESNAHFSVYWTDTSRSHPSDNVKIYDGLEFRGRIVDGIPPDEPENKVPSTWANGTSILFYERVDCGSNHAASAKRPSDASDNAFKVPAFKKRKTLC